MSSTRNTPEARLDAIVETLTQYARLDFSVRAPVSEALDTIDAVATGLNMMAEDLDGAVASRRELEEAYRALQATQVQLVHAGKLAAIGQLASGVVHEVNNPATWAALALSMAQERLAELQATSPHASVDTLAVYAELDGLVRRASEGVSRILAVAADVRIFARAEADAMDLMVLDDVVRTICNLIEPSIRERAEVRLSIGDSPPVRGNRGRIGQILLNLVMNAAEALEQGGRRGLIDVSTTGDSDVACLVVEDSGPGISEAIRARIFDPFFTSRPTGLGLGLSLVADLVQQHRGEIVVAESEHGGARFEIRLPAARA